MQLLFLGSADSFGMNPNNFQSNMLLLSDTGKKLLIDCGTDIRFSLEKAHYKPQDVDAVYISHLHADHIGGLEWFAFHRKYVCHSDLPHLIIHEQLVDRLWEHSLSGGMETIKEKAATLQDFFIVHSVRENHAFTWENMQLKLIKTEHVYSNDHLMPSYAVNITYKGKSFLITTDTQFSPHIFDKYYQNATLIFHDCETSENPSGVHAHFSQLSHLSSLIKAKIWLYHFNEGKLPDAKAHGFRGFVKCGQIIDLI